jgi:hypothetical protein
MINATQSVRATHGAGKMKMRMRHQNSWTKAPPMTDEKKPRDPETSRQFQYAIAGIMA